MVAMESTRSTENLLATPDPQRGLLWGRAALLGVELGGVWLLIFGLEAQLQGSSIGGLMALHAGLIGAALWRLRAGREPTVAESQIELATDAALLAALIYFTGGYANPFISLLLVPLLLAATLLPTRATWVLAAWTVILYSLLAFWYQPLILTVSTASAIDLHLTGMWLNFIFTVLFVTLALVRLSAALNQRDRILAEARERALRDEQIFLLGMQAASAAHDLATPLAALKLGLDELGHEYAGDEELTPPLNRLKRQAERMQHTLARLAVAAGVGRAGEVAPAETFEAWLRQTFEHWQLMRPQVNARLGTLRARALAEPLLVAPAAWVSILTTVLNNAADASPGEVILEAEARAEGWEVRVLDRGPGFGPGFERAGPKAGGWGVGLRLAQASLERLGGRLEITARHPGGGSCVSLYLPEVR